MIKSREIIVIGGNAAGAAAAAKAKRVNPEANVTIFEASEYISTGTCEIPYVLSGEIKDYKDLLIYDPATFRNEKGAIKNSRPRERREGISVARADDREEGL